MPRSDEKAGGRDPRQGLFEDLLVPDKVPTSEISEQLSKISQALISWGDTQTAKVDSDSIARLVNLLRSERKNIDYTNFGMTFLAAYHRTNVRKTLQALTECRAIAPSNAIDLGCGSGASAVAIIIHWILLNGGVTPLKLTLVDSCREQLILAQEALDVVRHAAPGLDWTAHFVEADALQFLEGGHNADLIVAAHFFTENRESAPDLVNAINLCLGPGADFIIVERGDDPTLNIVQEALGAWPQDKWGGVTSVLSIDPVTKRTREYSGSWLATSRPSESLLARLVDAYFEAWRSGSTDIIRNIFHPQATYQEKPFTEPLRGVCQIARYWDQKVVPQQNRNILVKRIAFNRNSVFIEWSASFNLDSGEHKVRGEMIIEAVPGHLQIAALREYFRAEHPIEEKLPQ